MHAVQLQVGGGRQVMVTWPEGSTDQIDGFASERAAQAWIETESLSWETARRAAAT
ncbi:hypothetical protein BH10PSE9_BH10PSE9_09940 [soil metagenome]